MEQRLIGSTGLRVSRIGFGAFKIGRNEGIKYPQGYNLPTDEQAAAILHGVLDLGVSYIDTAPAYGLSEQRIGTALTERADEFVVSTKVGETFEDGVSIYDYSETAVRQSIERSRNRLQREVLDVVFVHSNGDDQSVLNGTDVVGTLLDLRASGVISAIGFSGKTVAGAQAALEWADVLMVAYHKNDTSHEQVIAEAASRNIAVIVKKGLSSGHLSPAEAIRLVLNNPGVTSLVIGGLNLDHMRANIAAAESLMGKSSPDA